MLRLELDLRLYSAKSLACRAPCSIEVRCAFWRTTSTLFIVEWKVWTVPSENLVGSQSPKARIVVMQFQTSGGRVGGKAGSSGSSSSGLTSSIARFFLYDRIFLIPALVLGGHIPESLKELTIV